MFDLDEYLDLLDEVDMAWDSGDTFALDFAMNKLEWNVMESEDIHPAWNLRLGA